jgi:hypothetical protein
MTLVEVFEVIIELVLVCVVRHREDDNRKKIMVQPYQAPQF